VIDMPCISITVTRLDAELTELWDAPVETVALRRGR
jgi:dihydroxyacetone kinase-like protein